MSSRYRQKLFASDSLFRATLLEAIVLANIIGDKRADIFRVVARCEDAVKTHLLKLHFHIAEVMFTNYRAATDVQQNVAEAAFDAALT